MSREYGHGTGCFDDIEAAREFARVVAKRDGIGFIYAVPVNGRPLFLVTYSPPWQVRADFVERVIAAKVEHRAAHPADGLGEIFTVDEFNLSIRQ